MNAIDLFAVMARRGLRSLCAIAILSLCWVSLAEAADAGVVSSGAGDFFFRFLFGLTLFGALATVLQRNPVISSLCLVGTLISTGVIYLLMNATFLAAMQVLVYAGAVMVLFVFVVMSVGKPQKHYPGMLNGAFGKAIGIIGTVLCLTPLLRLLVSIASSEKLMPKEGSLTGFGSVEAIGELLFTRFLFPFEAISLLLLVAIVGAVMVSRKEAPTDEEESAHG